jgi:hypothetical protein
MAKQKNPEYYVTRDWLLENIDRFLDANIETGWLDDEALGWAACEYSSLVPRLRDGGDIRTYQMEQILAYMQDPVPPPKWEKHVLTPIKLTRRIYE